MALAKIPCIYCITNTVNDKKYIGKTNEPGRRWRDHKALHNKVGDIQYNKLLYKAMRKYGVDKFTYTILQVYKSDQEALDDEDRWIDELKSRSNQNGYNCLKGGSGPDRREMRRKTRKKVFHTESSKAKLGKSVAAAHEKERLMFVPVLTSLHNKGLSNKQIREETGLCAVTVRKWLKKLGLTHNPSKPWSKPLTLEISELANQGKTVKEISSVAGICEKTVRKLLKQNDLSVNHCKTGPEKGRVNPEFEAKKAWAIPIIIEMCDQGKGKREIRKCVGMGIHFVAKIMREHKANKKKAIGK